MLFNARPLQRREKMHEGTCEWTGASGAKYNYYIFAIPPNFDPNQNGNYIYTKIVNNLWTPIYIGQGDLRDRTTNHHKANCIASKGATHVHAKLTATEAARKSEEADLLAMYTNAYAPNGCNEKLGG
jgi:hypothetical protein